MMENNYELILGLEIHLQLKTKRKLFSYAKGLKYQTNEPNRNICPASLGLPGALPVLNKEALKLGQKMAYALTGNLNNHIIFQRKNYFYPDLPKGYQITCPHDPLSTGGEMDLSYWSNTNDKICFREIHIEEDTGKSTHKDDVTLLDYNKSSVPLLEIVTEPGFRNVDLAIEFCKEIQRTARLLKVSDADLEKGNMRLEANISVREKGQLDLPDYRVEIKNINSFSFLRKAVNYEYNRQSDLLSKGEGNRLIQETRGFNEKQGCTFSQRTKEDVHDYRYFNDPDIPPVYFDSDWLKEVKRSVVKLPSQLRNELLQELQSKHYIDVLIDSASLYDKYKALVKLGLSHKRSANCVVNEIRYKNLSAGEIYEHEKNKLKEKLTDKSVLAPIIKEVVNENPKVVDQYKEGKESVIKYLIGEVMKKSEGKADPIIVSQLLTAVLAGES